MGTIIKEFYLPISNKTVASRSYRVYKSRITIHKHRGTKSGFLYVTVERPVVTGVAVIGIKHMPALACRTRNHISEYLFALFYWYRFCHVLLSFLKIPCGAGLNSPARSPEYGRYSFSPVLLPTAGWGRKDFKIAPAPCFRKKAAGAYSISPSLAPAPASAFKESCGGSSY